MIRALTKQILSLVMSSGLAFPPMSVDAISQASSQPESSYAGQGAPLTAQELQALVAPIALYPDALVAQVLGAATYPDDVAVAQYWLEQNKNLSGSELMQAVDKQTWDPSIKALTQFPSVLDNMAKNLSWVSSLGEAYHNQSSEVMSAIQTLRAQAKAAGNLKSGSQITVVQQSPQTIVIQPVNPQIVYVPQYNPTLVYGTPYVTPGYSTADLVATSILSFGAGMAVGALIGGGGGCCSWGWNSWGCNWHGGAVVYNQNNFYGNASWHGGYYGGGYSAYGPNGSAHFGAGYNPRTGTYSATHQGSNGYSNWGSSVASRNGNSAYTQHYSNAQGSIATMQTSSGGRMAASSTAYGNTAAGRTASGNQYAAHNGTAYKNTGGGWEKNSGSGWSNVNKSSNSWGSSDAARGWGQRASSGSSAFSGWGGRSGSTGFGGGDRFGGESGGWASRSASSRGWGSRGGGGGWGGGGFRGGGFRR